MQVHISYPVVNAPAVMLDDSAIFVLINLPSVFQVRRVSSADESCNIEGGKTGCLCFSQKYRVTQNGQEVSPFGSLYNELNCVGYNLKIVTIYYSVIKTPGDIYTNTVSMCGNKP